MASQDWFEKDFYAVLDVPKDVSEADLKKTYRKLARKYHPDSNPGNAAAEEKFKEISEAYDVLRDPKSRSEYDQIRAMGAGGARFAPGADGTGGFEDVFSGMFNQGGYRQQNFQGGGANYEDLLSGLFGGGGGGGFGGGFGGGYQRGPQKGSDVRAHTSLNFMTAIRGDTIDLQTADGRTMKVRIPAGVKDGQKIKLKGKGEPSPNGGEAGDLYLEVAVKPHPVFTRDGDNILVDVPVTFGEAVRGATIEVPTLDGDTVKMKVPAHSKSGRTLRLKGRGVKHGRQTGDLLARVRIAVPQRLNAEQEQALDAFIAASPEEDPRAELKREARQ